MKDTDTAITQENNIMESPEVLEIQAKGITGQPP